MNKEYIEGVEREITKEIGYVSALFMSQGDIKARDIVMPSTELQETVDRIMLYVNTYANQVYKKGYEQGARDKGEEIKNFFLKSDEHVDWISDQSVCIDGNFNFANLLTSSQNKVNK